MISFFKPMCAARSSPLRAPARPYSLTHAPARWPHAPTNTGAARLCTPGPSVRLDPPPRLPALPYTLACAIQTAPVGTQAAPHSHSARRSASPSDNGSLPSYTTCDNCQTRSISVHQPNKYTWHRLLACPPEPSSECDICGGCLDSSLNDMSLLTRTAQPHYCFRCGDSFARGDRLLAHSQVGASGS